MGRSLPVQPAEVAVAAEHQEFRPDRSCARGHGDSFTAGIGQHLGFLEDPDFPLLRGGAYAQGEIQRVQVTGTGIERPAMVDRAANHLRHFLPLTKRILS
jgi:hypothetical protein